jgi:glycosyltransferase involved in cell wall biosynthesis
VLLAGALVRPLQLLIRSGYDFDVIDAYYFYPDGVAAALLGRYFGKPVIITAFGTDISLIPRHRLPRRMIQWASRSAAGITTVCRALKDRLLEMGVADESIRVILHGVDLELFQPPHDRGALRSRLGLACTTLLSVGSLIELKGHHIAIQAMRALPDMELLIAGDGDKEQSLKKLARSLNVDDRVRFLGHVNQEDLPAYFGAADVLVLASSREGIANVLLESMACGTPVVATNVWGSPEVSTSPEAGILRPERTPEGLIQSVRTLLAYYPNPADTRRFVERLSWDRTTELHLALLDDILGRPSR